MEKRLLVADLYKYLVELHKLLRQRGATDLAERVEHASRFAIGSSTELYAESEKAIEFVAEKGSRLLSDQELAEVKEKLREIDSEFKRIGGA
jgi:hypothetical protein